MEYSLYIHIPFCKKKCHYCDFVSYPGLNHMEAGYVNALLMEMKLYRGKRLKTVYIGGGTPTCIDPALISRILEGVGECFDTTGCVETSIEANPGTLSRGVLVQLKKSGIDRLSIGLQSWNPDELMTLGRIHGRQSFIQNYQLAREIGFDNINVDLIFGVPGQTSDSWRNTLKAVTALSPEHISCYSLIIEEGTEFYRMIKDGALSEPDPDLDRDMYHYAVKFLKDRGYDRYEISNFAQKGRECVHNLACWDNRPYIGIGAAAHSYTDGIRRWNTPDIFRYCRLLEQGRSPAESSEAISDQTRMFETIFLKLRTAQGIDYRQFQQEFGTDIRLLYKGQLDRLEEKGLVEMGEESLRLTSKGIDLSNSVFVEFLY